jgi:transposase
MDRVEAEAIYDAGREVCVQFMLDLAGRVRQLEERLTRLEAQARQDSRTSCVPLSMDPPKSRAQRRAEARAKAKELMRREGAHRKPGGQSGHRGAGRELRPEDQVDEIVDHYRERCGGCGCGFDDRQRRPSGRFGRHEVDELPPISVITVEHRTHQLRCRSCRARTSARLPDQVAGSVFGPRLQAAVVTLTAGYRVSRRGISELARDLFGVSLSTGTVDAICRRASDALAGPHLQLQDWVLDQGAVHVDETGWRTRGEARALWTATTPEATFLQISEHCNREQFNTLIGTAYPGIVISDRGNGYSHLDPARRQACWSHIKRDFARHADGLGEQKTFGEQGAQLTRRVAPPGAPTSTTRTATSSKPRSRRSRPSCAVCSSGPPRRRRATAGTASSPTTRSRSGGALDLRDRRRDRADQQPSRTRAPRPGYPPQSLARHPKQRRRAIR